MPNKTAIAIFIASALGLTGCNGGEERFDAGLASASSESPENTVTLPEPEPVPEPEPEPEPEPVPEPEPEPVPEPEPEHTFKEITVVVPNLVSAGEIDELIFVNGTPYLLQKGTTNDTVSKGDAAISNNEDPQTITVQPLFGNTDAVNAVNAAVANNPFGDLGIRVGEIADGTRIAKIRGKTSQFDPENFSLLSVCFQRLPGDGIETTNGITTSKNNEVLFTGLSQGDSIGSYGVFPEDGETEQHWLTDDPNDAAAKQTEWNYRDCTDVASYGARWTEFDGEEGFLTDSFYVGGLFGTSVACNITGSGGCKPDFTEETAETIETTGFLSKHINAGNNVGQGVFFRSEIRAISAVTLLGLGNPTRDDENIETEQKFVWLEEAGNGFLDLYILDSSQRFQGGVSKTSNQQEKFGTRLGRNLDRLNGIERIRGDIPDTVVDLAVITKPSGNQSVLLSDTAFSGLIELDLTAFLDTGAVNLSQSEIGQDCQGPLFPLPEGVFCQSAMQPDRITRIW